LSLHAASGKMIYLVNDFQHLDDLYFRESPTSDEKKITNLNAALWDKLTMVPVERIPYKAADGWAIDGFLVKPVGWEAGKKYPMILSIHGGPAACTVSTGSTNFRCTRRAAGPCSSPIRAVPPVTDGRFNAASRSSGAARRTPTIMSGVDEVLKRNAWIDRDKLGVTGGSYGGFMTNWIVAHTNIFKAAVTLRSISNFVSDEGTRDGAYGHARDFGGDLYQNYDMYWKYSPVRYAVT
jgi:dipeptidyl aminopeptidase/acylaminoacyl peptidase